ncbi:MAG: hypothetical protein JWO06_1733 [Bacteroidota bacterium]|nr:hypothetical protein [Bacteroidota bacterium]
MKKLLLIPFFVFCMLLSANLNAQYCGGSGPHTCNIVSGYTAEGFYPPDDSFPCVTVGVPYDQVLQVHTPPTASSGSITATLNYIIIDTISNLPCGLCWQSGDTTNRINGNATGCVRFKGTTFDAPGLYTLHIIVDANVTFGITLTERNQDLSSQGLHFEIRVKLPNDTCIAVDTLAVGNKASIPGGITTPTISGNTSLCSGASTTLTAGGANYYAYAWSNGTFGATTHVSVPGTYIVTVYDNCNSATASVNVVNATVVPPTVTANGPTTFCQGGSVTLNAGSGYSAYSWTGGALSQTINVTQSGNYICTVTESGCPAVSNTISVTVNTSPSPTISAGGPLSFCQGDSVSLNAGAGYAAYSWSTGSSNQSIEAKQSGVYRCTVTQNGCQGMSNTVTVTVNNPVPTLTSSGPLTFCTGGSDTLSVGSGYSSYLWSTTANTPSIVITQSGSYTCTVTQGGCLGVSDTLTAIVASNLNPVIAASPSLNICPGSSAVLDAGAGYSTYAWSSGSNNQTTTVNSANTYIVTVTQGGCSGTASVTVNVGNFPITVSVTPAGPVSVCVGAAVTLDAGPGYATYSWSDLTNAQTTQPTSTGNYTVTVSQNSCTGTASVNVTFNALPVPAITSPGPLSICAGGIVTLDAGSGYTTYNWSNGDNTQTTQISTADTYKVTVVDNNGCQGSDSAIVAVSAPPVAVIVGTGGGCPGQAITLSTTTTYDHYHWSNGDTTATTSVDFAGTFDVSVTVNGCVGSSAVSYNYSVSALPAEYVSQAQSNGNTTLQVSPSGTGYHWLSQQTQGGAYTAESATTQSYAITCSSTPVYYTAIVSQNGCNDTAAAVAIVCTGVDYVSSLVSFSVKPNPATDVLYVTYELNESAPVNVSITDLTGRVLITASGVYERGGEKQQEIKLSGLASGIYVLNFVTDKGSFNTRFIKQ